MLEYGKFWVFSVNERERHSHPSVTGRRLVNVGLVDDEENLYKNV